MEVEQVPARGRRQLEQQRLVTPLAQVDDALEHATLPRSLATGTLVRVNLGPGELLIILLIVLLIFGGAKLPQLARSLGRAQSEFKKGVNESTTATDDEGSTPTV